MGVVLPHVKRVRMSDWADDKRAEHLITNDGEGHEDVARDDRDRVQYSHDESVFAEVCELHAYNRVSNLYHRS